MKLRSPKIVSDPLWGIIDIGEYLPMIDVPDFQSLGYKYQLGLAFLIFPAATHSRKQHCLGAYHRTKRLTEDWLGHGFIKADEARSLRAYALYHDIGHGPFSHTTESIYGIDHDEIGLIKVRNLRKEIEAADIDFKAVEKLFAHEDPLYRAVFDKNVGAEKFDYLSRDAFYTIREVPGVDYLTKFIYYINGQVVVDEKAIDQVRALQDFYMKMYKHVYLRKKSIIAQRLVEKMAYELYLDGVTQKEIWSFTDFGLLGRLEVSENAVIRALYQRLMSNQLPRSAVELRYGRYTNTRHLAEKGMQVFGLDDDTMDRLLKHEKMQGPAGFKQLEGEIAQLLGLPVNDVLVTPPVFPAGDAAKRFEPSDVPIYVYDGSIRMLSDFYPQHFNAMREYGKSHHSLRICVPEEHREAASKRAEAVRDHLLSLLR